MNSLSAFASLFVLLVSVSSLSSAESDDRVTGRFSFVEFNPALPLGFGLQVTVPLSFFIPRWAMLGTHGRSFASDVLRARPTRRRQSTRFDCPTQVTSLEDYLEVLHVDTEPCQKRFICEVASNPNKFQPLSGILLKKLVFNDTRQMGDSISNRGGSSVLQTHWLSRAATLGAQSKGRKCSVYFSKCPTEAESVLDMGLLGWWQLFTSVFKVHVIGETDSNWYS